MSFPVIYNAAYGGFTLSFKAIRMYNAKSTTKKLTTKYSPIDRTDEIMAAIVEELKLEASGEHSKLKVIHIPEKYRNCVRISEYDGMESVSIDFAKYRLEKIAAIIQEASEAQFAISSRELAEQIEAIRTEPEYDIYNQVELQEDEPPYEEPALERSHFTLQ